ncbi:MAG: tetraacyldisaccharide 4'-kinase, partial [Bacteroidaceae bacterium]|nr:tetraacyldisaccharide 4'-kinase [Bacteroidaceae bacterium]
MEGDHIKICHWLTPLSWLYGLGVGVRNAMFDCGLLPSEKFDVPVISVGNITVGGSGKTPHTEYLVRLLRDKYQVAILSRGYKRKSKGFQFASDETTMETIGDEPFQMKRKYPEAHVAVDKDRRNGIRNLLDKNVNPPVGVVILDDAFQHRYVSPDVNVLLMDYHRLICFDKLLPAGRLREPAANKRRADIVVVTKCPQTITPMEQRGIERSLALFPWQRLYFTYFKYGSLYPLFDKTREELSLDSLRSSNKKA